MKKCPSFNTAFSYKNYVQIVHIKDHPSFKTTFSWNSRVVLKEEFHFTEDVYVPI